MRRRDDGSGDIYLLSLDTFMIMSVVGLSLGMIFFLLNPSFKKGKDDTDSATSLECNISTYDLLSKSDVLPLPVNSDIEYGEEIIFYENQLKNLPDLALILTNL